MVDTLNSASDWHQCAIYKLADWAKLRVLILLFFQLSCVTKNDICAQMLLHKVKQRNKTGVVGKFYTVDVLTAKNYKCSFKFAKITVKKLLASFLWTQCTCLYLNLGLDSQSLSCDLALTVLVLVS